MLVFLSLIPIVYSIGVLAVVAEMGDLGLNCVLGIVIKEDVPASFVVGRRIARRRAINSSRSAGGGSSITRITSQRSARSGTRLATRSWSPGRGRGGPVQHATATIATRPMQAYLWSALWFVQEMAIFAVGVLVFWKRPKDESARLFFWLCLVTVGAYMGGYHWTEIVVEPVLIYPFALFAMAVPVVSLHFYLVFPRANPIFEPHRRTILGLLYGIPLVFLAALWASMARIGWLRDQPGPTVSAAVQTSVGWIKWLALSYIGLSVVVFGLCIVCLLASYRAAPTRPSGTRRTGSCWRPGWASCRSATCSGASGGSRPGSACRARRGRCTSSRSCTPWLTP